MQTEMRRASDQTQGKFTHCRGAALRTTGAAVFAALLWLTPAPSATAQGARNAALDLLQNIYWRDYYSQISLPTDQYGNAVFGDVVMMKFPASTPGSIDITLKANQPFFLPLWTFLGNSYEDGSVDAFLDLNLYETLDISFTIDGRTVVTSRNVMKSFSQVNFAPPIPYNVSPYTAFIWVQGISTLQPGLAPGQHVLKLDAKNTDTEPLGGAVYEYHNTWNLTVEKARR